MNAIEPAPKIVVVVGEDNFDEDDGRSPEEAALWAAAHMLHEQAHGTEVAWRFCRQEPCRDLPHESEATGPAPLSSAGLF